MSKQLGKLTRLDLREYWGEEAKEFTPWLAHPDNLELLGESINIDLELVATESSVGPQGRHSGSRGRHRRQGDH